MSTLDPIQSVGLVLTGGLFLFAVVTVILGTIKIFRGK